MHFTTLALATLSLLAAANAATAMLYPFHGAPGSRFDQAVVPTTVDQAADAPGTAPGSTAQPQQKRLAGLPSDWLAAERIHLQGSKNVSPTLAAFIKAYTPDGELTRNHWEALVTDYPELQQNGVSYEDLAGADGEYTVEIFTAYLQYMTMCDPGKKGFNRSVLPSYGDRFSDSERKLLTYQYQSVIDWKRFRFVAVPKLIFNKYSNGSSYLFSGKAWKSAIADLSSFLGISISPEGAFQLINDMYVKVSRDKFVSFALFKTLAGEGDCITSEAWASKYMDQKTFKSISGANSCVDFSEWHKDVLA